MPSPGLDPVACCAPYLARCFNCSASPSENCFTDGEMLQAGNPADGWRGTKRLRRRLVMTNTTVSTGSARTTGRRSSGNLRVLRSVVVAALVSTVTACVTVDHNTAASLGTAGVQATQTLSTRASGAVQTLGELSQWWSVHDILLCVNVGNAEARKACIDGVPCNASCAVDTAPKACRQAIAQLRTDPDRG